MVDILLATYNGEKYIKEQIDSILAQTYKNYRIIIRDDGSKDNTIKIIKDYMDKFPDIIFLIKDNKKCGSSVKNFFELTKHSNADYIIFCDQDDVWFPNKINDTLMAMKEQEKKNGKNIPILIFANYTIVNEKLEIMDQLKNTNQVAKCNLKLNRLIVQNYVTGCLTMINKSLCKIMGDYDDKILMHDWWAALIASAMGIVYHLDEDLMFYRQHSNNVVGAVNVKSNKYRIHKLFDPSTKYSHTKYKNQIMLFRDRYESDIDTLKLEIIDNFLNIFNTKNKFKKINMLIKGKYFKSDFIRILGQLFYI